MDNADYPALFRSADNASNEKQKFYLRLILLEYCALFVAAVLAMETFKNPNVYLFYALIFVASLGALLARAFLKPEQDWYRSRALAESVKTLTWRYMMWAHPFDDRHEPDADRADFVEHLNRLFAENRATAEKVTPQAADEPQITAAMDRARALSLAERKAIYLSGRVGEQRSWYKKKATYNRDASRRWVCAGVASYVIALALVLTRIRFPAFSFWPIEPVIVFASSIVGWMQIKKFNELTAAYTVAAHEIGLIEPRLDAVQTDQDFSNTVNEAELAFSREHTMWIARQSN